MPAAPVKSNPSSTTSSTNQGSSITNGNARANGKPSLFSGQLYFVCCAKMVDDKHEGIYLASVFFGGVATSKEGAELIARDCVNTVRGGTVIPRVYCTFGPHQLPGTMKEANQRFLRLENEMMDAEEIIANRQRKK